MSSGYGNPYGQGGYQQGYPPYSPPPRPPDNTKAIVIIIISAGVLMLIGGVFFFAMPKAKKKRSERHYDYKPPGNSGEATVYDQESACLADYSGCTESSSVSCEKKMQIRKKTNELLAQIKLLRAELNKTVISEIPSEGDGQSECTEFFIESGRAEKLQGKLQSYIARAFVATGETQISDGYYVVLQIEGRYMGSATKHGVNGDWVSDHFGGSLDQCRNSLNVLYSEIREFERNRVNAVD